MVTLSDQELILHYLNTGHGHYFAQLYTRHRHEVYKRCLFYTGNQADADDFVQDIFVRLTLKLKTYKGEAKFTTWLHAITVNYCLDQLRKERQTTALKNAYLLDSTYTYDWTALPDEVHFQVFDQVLSQLSASQLELLLNKYKVGTRINDIASSQDLTPSAVKMRIKRAREYAQNLYKTILSEEYL